VDELLERRGEVIWQSDGPYEPIRPIGRRLVLGGCLGLKSPPSIKGGGEVCIEQARSRDYSFLPTVGMCLRPGDPQICLPDQDQ
jgi:hypothetical protein